METNAPQENAVRKAPLHSYRELVVWQKAIALVIDVYSITKEFPRDEIYGLTSQLHIMTFASCRMMNCITP
jgi:hypothetical protein